MPNASYEENDKLIREFITRHVIENPIELNHNGFAKIGNAIILHKDNIRIYEDDRVDVHDTEGYDITSDTHHHILSVRDKTNDSIYRSRHIRHTGHTTEGEISNDLRDYLQNL